MSNKHSNLRTPVAATTSRFEPAISPSRSLARVATLTHLILVRDWAKTARVTSVVRPGWSRTQTAERIHRTSPRSVLTHECALGRSFRVVQRSSLPQTGAAVPDLGSHIESRLRRSSCLATTDEPAKVRLARPTPRLS
jgi:hypothetical protein